MPCEQRRRFCAQRLVACAGLAQEAVALDGLELDGRVEQLPQSLPALGSQPAPPCCSSPISHALAAAQSRLTVLGDTPSTSAVSSIESPPK